MAPARQTTKHLEEAKNVTAEHTNSHIHWAVTETEGVLQAEPIAAVTAIHKCRGIKMVVPSESCASSATYTLGGGRRVLRHISGGSGYPGWVHSPEHNTVTRAILTIRVLSPASVHLHQLWPVHRTEVVTLLFFYPFFVKRSASMKK